MPWTSIAKPSTADWTNVGPMGKEQYDQGTITYDSASTYYDGINPAQWTDVAKPTNGRVIYPGMATGLLMPLTYTREYDASSWVKVAKPN